MKSFRCLLGYHAWGEWAETGCHLEKMCSRCKTKRVKYPTAEVVLVKGLLSLAEKAVDRYFDRSRGRRVTE